MRSKRLLVAAFAALGTIASAGCCGDPCAPACPTPCVAKPVYRAPCCALQPDAVLPGPAYAGSPAPSGPAYAGTPASAEYSTYP